MSQQQAPQKANFLQTFLLVTTLFLGYQLFFGSKPEDTDKRTSSQVLKDIQKLNAEVKDITIASELPLYEEKLQQEAEKNKWSKSVVDDNKLYATLLAAQTQYSAGAQRNETERLSTAYNTLSSKEKEFSSTTLWIKSYKLPEKNGQVLEITAQSLLAQIGKDLQVKNKTEKIFGFFPGYAFFDSVVHLTGANPAFSYGFAALLVAAIVRIVVWPLSQKTFIHSRQMTQLMPLINELKEKYQGQELNQKMMELHKEYGINPASGCLPALAQIPLFLLIYQAMQHYRFEFKHGTFLWINPTLSKATNGFIAPNLGEQDYILIVLYGISMIVTTLLTPVSDPINGKQQRTTGVMMGAFFAVMMFFWVLPSAFVLYWLFTNVLTTAQTLRAHRLPIPPLMKKVAGTNQSVAVSSMMDKSMFKSTGVPKTQKPKSKKK
jgi:YidC/Oxa1 family membrane protein insertase